MTFMNIKDDEDEAQDGYGLPVDVEWRGTVAVIHMRRGENRCNMDFVNKINHALDQVERLVCKATL